MSVNWDEYSDLRAPIFVTDDKGLEVIVKKVKNSRWNGMSIERAYQLELEVLNLINKNYNCICGFGKSVRHFPQILDRSDEKCVFYLSKQGLDLNRYKKLVPSKIDKIKVPERRKQIQCISHNLEINKIKHLDLCSDNMCIHLNGVFSLIDFGISIIGDEAASDQIDKRNCIYDDYDQYIKMFKRTTYAILRQFNS